MGLTEREQQLLDELERSLSGSSADKSARKLRPANVPAKRIILGVIGVAVGISILLAGVINRLVPLGLAGFALMVSGVYLAASTSKAK